jgi:hypothetical protein
MPTSLNAYVQAYAATQDAVFNTFLGIESTKKGKVVPSSNKPHKAPKEFKFGCDPEAFVFCGKKPVPADSAGIPGTKAEPFKVDKGWVQVDGMAAEVNIEPANTFEKWDENLSTVTAQLEAMLPKGHTLKWIPSVTFSQEEFDKALDENKELGCRPDFDAWTGGVNPLPCPENPLVRCAGGHLHVGWTEDEDLGDLQHLLNCQDLVKQLDYYLAPWSLTKDDDKIRRTLYGKLGACRYKPYGVEYRVLSNFWVPSQELRLQVWNRMVHAIDMMNSMFLPDRIPKKLLNSMRESVNSGIVDAEVMANLQYPVETLVIGYSRW